MGFLVLLFGVAGHGSACAQLPEDLGNIDDAKIVLVTNGGFGGGKSTIELGGKGMGSVVTLSLPTAPEPTTIKRVVKYSSLEFLSLLSQFFDDHFFDQPERMNGRLDLELKDDGRLVASRQAVIDGGAGTLTITLGEYRKSLRFSLATGMSPLWVKDLSNRVVIFAEKHVEGDEGLYKRNVEPLTIGDTFTIMSKILGEERRINVYAPAAYAAAEKDSFPVLYMPDGGLGEDFLHIAGLVQISSLNGTMRPFLLVGIENTQRRRDLTPPTSTESDREIAPQVGGSAAFRSFIRDELMPAIDAAYRTTGEPAIVGESLAGLFVVETLLVEPQLFDTYIAIDPSLWWDGGRLVDTAVSLLSGQSVAEKSLYLAVSNQGELAASGKLLASLLQMDVPNLKLAYAEFPNETHLTIYQPAALAGFRTVFAPAAGQ